MNIPLKENLPYCLLAQLALVVFIWGLLRQNAYTKASWNPTASNRTPKRSIDIYFCASILGIYGTLAGKVLPFLLMFFELCATFAESPLDKSRLSAHTGVAIRTFKVLQGKAAF